MRRMEASERGRKNKLLPPLIQIQSELILREEKYLLSSSIKEEARQRSFVVLIVLILCMSSGWEGLLMEANDTTAQGELIVHEIFSLPRPSRRTGNDRIQTRK